MNSIPALELTRLSQVLETERRLAKSLPQLTLDSLWRRRILDLLAQEEEEKSKILSESRDKTLPRLASTYGILRRLGFQHAASIQCLQSVQNLDLDEALDWVCTMFRFSLVRVLTSCQIYLRCDTDELLDSRS